MSEHDMSDESVMEALSRVQGFSRLLRMKDKEAADHVDTVIAKAAFSIKEINQLQKELAQVKAERDAAIKTAIANERERCVNIVYNQLINYNEISTKMRVWEVTREVIIKAIRNQS